MKILAVDDDEFILDILGEAIRAIGGHDMVMSSSGDAALMEIHAASTPFDCFLLDIQMPGMTGVDLCRRIRSIPEYSDTPILMITAMSDKRYVDQSFAAGASDYVTKPFDVLELDSRISFVSKSIEKSDAVFPAAQTLDLIVEQMTSEKIYDLADVVPVLDVDMVLHLHAFENYLAQLSRTQYSASAIFAIGVQNIETIHARSSGQEFGDQINDIAEAISVCMRGIQGFFTYFGNGAFCCVIEGRNREALDDLLNELDMETSRLELVYRNGTPVDIFYSLGDAITPSIFTRSSVTGVLNKAVQKLDHQTIPQNPKTVARRLWA